MSGSVSTVILELGLELGSFRLEKLGGFTVEDLNALHHIASAGLTCIEPFVEGDPPLGNEVIDPYDESDPAPDDRHDNDQSQKGEEGAQ